MPDPDPGDLKDNAGRLRRLAVSLVVGIALGVVAYLIADHVVPRETTPAALVTARQMSAPGFVLWIGLIAGVGGFAITLVVLERIATKRWRDAQVPRARALD